MTREDLTDIAVDIAAYFEDILSGTNVWKSFVLMYRKKYRRNFPFYQVCNANYFFDEPNLADVRFLLWNGFNRTRENSFINPENPFIELVAENIYGLLCDEYETAPDTPEMHDYIYNIDGYGSYLYLREICSWLAEDCYLTRCTKDIDFNDLFGKMDEIATEDLSLYAIRTFLPMNMRFGPLALPATDWLSKMLKLSDDRCFHAVSENVAEVKSTSIRPYIIRRVNKNSVVIEGIDAVEYKIDIDSFQSNTIETDLKTGRIIIASLLFYNDLWHVNGIMYFSDNKDAFRQSKKDYFDSIISKEQAYRLYVDRMGGRQISFYHDFKELKSSLGLDKVQGSMDEDIKAEIAEVKNIAVFVNSDGSLSVMPEIALDIKSEDNPMYDPAHAAEYAAVIILNQNLSTDEFRRYILSNNMIPDANLKSLKTPAESRRFFKANSRFLNDFLNRDTLITSM